ncbi:MAG: helix-turn-helix transcriptional regulator [Reyranella sp.]
MNFWVGVRFDPRTVQRVLPQGLSAVAGATGGFGISRGPGDGNAPGALHASAYVDVEGFDSPDGRPGRFTYAWFSQAGPGSAGDADATAGPEEQLELAIDNARRLVSARIGDSGGAKISISAEITSEHAEDIRFCINNISHDRGGALSIDHHPTFIRRRNLSVPLSIQMEAPPEHLFGSLMIKEFVWAALNEDIYFTVGLGRQLGKDGKLPIESIVLLLSHSGRGVVVVAEDGEVVVANDAARTMLGAQALNQRSLNGGIGAEADALRRVADSALRSGSGVFVTETVAIPRPGGMRPVLALGVAAPAEAALAGFRRAAVIILTDPDALSRPARDTAGTLQLLALTPFEARIAAASATGLTRREVACRLGLSEATVRVTLSIIFDKLGVARQSELARIVSRLELFS